VCHGCTANITASHPRRPDCENLQSHTHKTTVCLETQPQNQATLTLHSQQLDVCTELDEQDRQLSHMLQHLATAGFQRFTAGRQGTFFFKARPLHVKLLKQALILTDMHTVHYTLVNKEKYEFHYISYTAESHDSEAQFTKL